jgi:hypothetical protein
MKAKCRHCKNKWSVSRRYSGTTITCPACREPVGLAPSAPIGALTLAVLISTSLAVGVSSWMLSKKTDIGRVNAAAAELQAKIDATTAQLDKFNTELIRIQSQAGQAAAQSAVAQPVIAQTDNTSQLQIVPGRPTESSSETPDQTNGTMDEQANQTETSTQSQTGQEETQKSDQKIDDVDSLLIFEGTINRAIGPQLILVNSAKKANEFTYSNFKYVPPFVLDETAVVKVNPGVKLSGNIAGSKITIYVVADGRYEYKEIIGAIEIPKTVNQYRETNRKNAPKQRLVEFRPDQAMPGTRGPRQPPPTKGRTEVRIDEYKKQMQEKQMQQRRQPR